MSRQAKKIFALSILGMTLVEARESNPGELIREVLVDGKAMALSRDLNPQRINVELQDGIIIALDGFY